MDPDIMQMELDIDNFDDEQMEEFATTENLVKYFDSKKIQREIVWAIDDINEFLCDYPHIYEDDDDFVRLVINRGKYDTDLLVENFSHLLN